MPTNSSRMSYAEKRRQWKEEWKRRYRERFGTSTAPPSTLTPLAAVEGDAGMTLSNANAATPIESASTLHRYFVTYNPNTKTYHVSRRPPSSSVLTDDGQSGMYVFDIFIWKCHQLFFTPYTQSNCINHLINARLKLSN